MQEIAASQFWEYIRVSKYVLTSCVWAAA